MNWRKKMKDILELCKSVKSNSGYIASLTTAQKNDMLNVIASALVKNEKAILDANKKDLELNSDKPKHILDRLALNSERILAMADGVKKVIDLPDPIGKVIEDWTVPNGLNIKKVSVPLGVIAIIYEARPNVTVDTIALALKTGNAIVLRGSKDAINSNTILTSVIKDALSKAGYNSGFIGLVTDTTRDGANYLMTLRDCIDVLVPRGSANLINTVVQNSKIPVIETGAGNCHAYIHATADLEMAKKIILNGKLSRPSVCNALESLLVDKTITAKFLPDIIKELNAKGVEVLGCGEAVKICPTIPLATEDDFYTEFLSLKIAVKVVNGVDDAINHINKYSTKHSEVIVAKDTKATEKFLNLVDSACVYVNASTRFTDGFEFGFGAELGISTQKLHARGPLGLQQLTSQKYVVQGTGQVR